MSENIQTTEPKQENEIDLLALMGKFFRALEKGVIFCVKGIAFGFLSLLKFLIRRFVLLCLFIALGIGVAVTYYIASPASYEGEALIQCNGFQSQDLENETSKLNRMLHNGDALYVAKILGISTDLVKQIQSIRMGYGIDLDEDGIVNEVSYNEEGRKNIIEESILKGSKDEIGTLRKKVVRGRIPELAFLNLQTSTQNAVAFQKIGNALFTYIRKNPSLSAAYESNKISIIERINQLDFQITRLDSLQSIEYIEMTRKNNRNSASTDKIVFTSYQEKERQLFHNEMLGLEERRNLLKAKLRLQTASITILSDFQPILGKPSLIKSLLYCGLTFGILGMLAGLFFENRKRIKDFIAEAKA